MLTYSLLLLFIFFNSKGYVGKIVATYRFNFLPTIKSIVTSECPLYIPLILFHRTLFVILLKLVSFLLFICMVLCLASSFGKQMGKTCSILEEATNDRAESHGILREKH